MPGPSRTALVGGLLVVAAVVAAVDLHRIEATTLVLYTTPALRDLLEQDVLPRWIAGGGAPVEPVYVAAGEQYNRLRMSGARPEADVFLHASPFYIEKGYEDGYFRPYTIPNGSRLNASFHSLPRGDGYVWYAFAWSPLVEVYASTLGTPPDLATAQLRYGLPHPILSNNGIYAVLFFEAVSPEAGRRALDRTVVQPVNARTNILGVADGSFDVTLGYEAVARFYQTKGAKVAYAPPLIAGERATTPVLLSAGVVQGIHIQQSENFVRFLFEDETQQHLIQFHLRAVAPEFQNASGSLPMDLAQARSIHFDWAEWKGLENALPRYEVTRGRYG